MVRFLQQGIGGEGFDNMISSEFYLKYSLCLILKYTIHWEGIGYLICEGVVDT